MQAVISPAPSKFVQTKKNDEKKQIKYPRYHNDSLRLIISDLKIENNILRKKLENMERMFKMLEKENIDIKMNMITLREMDILGDDYYINNPDNMEIEDKTN